ncbi:MAG TPA: hypothetical protein VEB43_18485 [Anaeromyxobacter sp.]|nr:hypothetical protein [Anaeromyxobacter sp.]
MPRSLSTPSPRRQRSSAGPARVVAALIAGILPAALGSGCDDGKKRPPSQTQSTQVLPQTGGTLTLGAATLLVPPGAVLQPTTITVTSRGAGDSDPGFVSPLFDYGPAGLTFQKPAILSIATAYTPGPGNQLRIAARADDGTIEPIPSSAGAGGVAAPIRHFSEYGAYESPPCGEACESSPSFDCCGAQCVPIGTYEHCFGCTSCAGAELCCRDFSYDPPTYNGPVFLCVDVKGDNAEHCGACGVDCSQSVLGGPDCCAGLCVNRLTDPRNCGTCGNACPGGRDCVDGRCEICEGENCAWVGTASITAAASKTTQVSIFLDAGRITGTETTTLTISYKATFALEGSSSGTLRVTGGQLTGDRRYTVRREESGTTLSGCRYTSVEVFDDVLSGTGDVTQSTATLTLLAGQHRIFVGPPVLETAGLGHHTYNAESLTPGCTAARPFSRSDPITGTLRYSLDETGPYTPGATTVSGNQTHPDPNDPDVTLTLQWNLQQQ